MTGWNWDEKEGEGDMKKYLLIIEDESLWQRFKESIEKDINTELMEMIREKVKMKGAKR